MQNKHQTAAILLCSGILLLRVEAQNDSKSVNADLKNHQAESEKQLTGVFTELFYCKEIQTEFNELRNNDNKNILAPFTNSISKTCDKIKSHIGLMTDPAVGAYTLSREFLDNSEVDWSRYGGILSPDYWQSLRDGLLNFGYVESHKLDHPALMAKAIIKDWANFPKNAKLVTNGPYSGFFMTSNFDIVVPGSSFYAKILAGDVPASRFGTVTVQYYNPEMVNDFSLFNLVAETEIAMDLIKTDAGRRRMAETFDSRDESVLVAAILRHEELPLELLKTKQGRDYLADSKCHNGKISGLEASIHKFKSVPIEL